MIIEIYKARFRTIFGLCFLFFICLLTISCSNEVSVSESNESKNVTADDGLVKVSGENENGSYSCSGFDSELIQPGNFRIPKDDDYDCKDGQLVINR